MQEPAEAAASRKEKRLALIAKLEALRGSRVISYIVSTRKGLSASVEKDVIRKFFDHVNLFGQNGKKPHFDLFLHTDGGDGTIVWHLMTLIREYASRISVLIPHRAMSAGTIIALGADDIVMHPMARLSPIDPTVKNSFNPKDEKGERVGVSVEDMESYLRLVREELRIKGEEGVLRALELLTANLHPLALGNVARFHAQSRMLAEKLLRLHVREARRGRSVENIAERLNSKLYFHGHPIAFHEAEEIGLPVVRSNAEEAETMWELYRSYEESMRMEEGFSPLDYFLSNRDRPLQEGESDSVEVKSVPLVYIESTALTYLKNANYIIWGRRKEGKVVVDMETRRSWWATSF